MNRIINTNPPTGKVHVLRNGVREIKFYQFIEPQSPREARALMRAAAMCWRRVSLERCLTISASFHLSRAKELRDLARRLEGDVQREFSLR